MVSAHHKMYSFQGDTVEPLLTATPEQQQSAIQRPRALLQTELTYTSIVTKLLKNDHLAILYNDQLLLPQLTNPVTKNRYNSQVAIQNQQKDHMLTKKARNKTIQVLVLSRYRYCRYFVGVHDVH